MKRLLIPYVSNVIIAQKQQGRGVGRFAQGQGVPAQTQIPSSVAFLGGPAWVPAPVLFSSQGGCPLLSTAAFPVLVLLQQHDREERESRLQGEVIFQPWGCSGRKQRSCWAHGPFVRLWHWQAQGNLAASANNNWQETYSFSPASYKASVGSVSMNDF